VNRFQTPATAPRLSVLVCTRNRSQKLTRAVESILANDLDDFELVIVDQSTDDATMDVVARHADARIRYIRSDTIGLARSRNIAIRASRSETLVFTDDDCICDKRWLSAVLTEFEADRSLAGVFGRVLPYGEGNGGTTCPSVIASMERRVVDRPAIPHLTLGHGNNMSFRKSAFRRVGLFIESLGAGTAMKAGEDTEFIYRALRARLRFLYSPDPLVYHDNWLPADCFATVLNGYVFAGSAVFTKFAARMDRLAMRHLIRSAREFVRDRSKRYLFYHLIGALAGVRYACSGVPILTKGDA